MRLAVALALTRPRITCMVGAAALFGALLHGGGDPFSVAIACVGSMLVCAGCSALNQLQERARDARMARTASRPLPSGRMTAAEVRPIAAALFAGGAVLYFLAGGWPLVAVGALIVAVYNGLYTPLKPRTQLALLVGGTVGALPPLTGWVAAGGGVLDAPIVLATGVLFLWQVPHFWLLAEKHREDYARAGFPVPAAVLPERLYRLLTALWVGAFFLGLACLAARGGAGASAAGFGALGAGAVVSLSALGGNVRLVQAALNGSLALAFLGQVLRVF